MLKKLLILLAITLVFGGIQKVSAQTPKRIQFAKGKNSAVVKGTTGTDGIYYVIGAKSGQKLVLTLSPKSNLGIKVETENADGQSVLLRKEVGGTYEIGLDANGDYTIFIGSINHKSTPFTLTVKITKLADI